MAKHKSEDVLRNSKSGGAFTAISDIFLKENGIICGVDFDDKFCVVHKMSNTEEGRDRFLFSTTEMDELQMDERFYKLFFGLSTISRPSCSV
ncbi:MAG: 4Fe-4S ferredoxin, partial [Fusobacteriia bacterium 4572_74]